MHYPSVQNLNEHVQDCLSDLCVTNKVTVTLSKDNDVKVPSGAFAVCELWYPTRDGSPCMNRARAIKCLPSAPLTP